MSVRIDLNQKTALVCGASAGIGRATAIALAQAGAKVIAIARRAARLEEVVAVIHADQGSAEYIVCDLSSEAGMLDMLNFVSSQTIHIVINNSAGSLARAYLGCGEVSL